MGIFDGLFNSNKNTSDNTSKSNVLNIEFTGFSKSNRDVAMKVSALHQAVNLISETIASLPLYKYEVLEDGSKVRSKHKINYLLNKTCNGYITSFDMKNMLIQSAILEGNGYILIKRNSDFEIEKLIPLKYSEVNVQHISNTDEVVYHISKKGYTGTYESYEVINLCLNSEDGISGKGILEIGKETIGLANEQAKFAGSALTNGSFAKALLSVPTSLSSEQRSEITQKLRSFFSGSSGSSVLVLPEDLQYKGISLSPTDVQLLEHQNFSIEEIARLLKLPSHMIGSSVKSGNYNNLEQSNLQFLSFTLLPYLRRIEELAGLHLLTEEEKLEGNAFFEFSIQDLLRTNRKDEIEYYVKALDAGIYSINEVRRKLNENKVEGLDVYTLSKFNSIVKDGQLINLVMSQVIDENQTVDDNQNTTE